MRCYHYPQGLARAVMRGQVPAVGAVLVSVQMAGRPGGWWTVPELVKSTGLSRRAVEHALLGRCEDGRNHDGVAAWVERDGRRWRLAPSALRSWVRVCWADLEALRKLPGLLPVRLWAWRLLTLDGARPHRSWRFDARQVARELGIRVSQVNLAMWGWRRRRGAVSAGLLDWCGGQVVRRVRLRADPPANAATCASVDDSVHRAPGKDPSVRSPEGASRTRVKLWQEIRELGIRIRLDLLELARRWVSKVCVGDGEQVTWDGSTLEFQSWLAEIRIGCRGPRWPLGARTWHVSICRRMLGEALAEVRAEQALAEETSLRRATATMRTEGSGACAPRDPAQAGRWWSAELRAVGRV